MNDSYESTRTLKSYRARKGLTIEQTSEILGWHFNTYSRRENNPLDYPIKDLCKIVQCLDGNYDEFFNALEQDYKSYAETTNSIENISS